MGVFSFRKAASAGLAAAGVVALLTSGCGGDKGGAGDAVVYTEPNVNVPTAGSSGAAPAPAAGSASAAPTATASNNAAPAPTPSAGGGAASGWGTLKGKVTFGGSPPAQGELVPQGKADKDATVCAKDAPIKEERLVVDGATKGVKNVLVYIPKPTAVNDEAKSNAASASLEFDQQNCTFKPHVIGFLNGAKVTLKSSDAVNHNINAKLRANSPFNQLLIPNAPQIFTSTTGERTPTEVGCDIHPWMKAYWLILDSPYFAVTNDKGEFEIKNVPAGAQKVVVWQEAVAKGGFVTAPSGDEVAIKAGDNTKDFTIDSGKILSGK